MTTTNRSREEWLYARRQAIGSSDAPAVVLGSLAHAQPDLAKAKGVFRTPLHVYLDKRGVYRDGGESPAMRWGRRLEQVVAEAFVEETGLRITPCTNAITRHPQRPWMAATPDYLVDQGQALLEVKTTGSAAGWGPSGSDEYPEGYLVQVLHQMECTGCPLGYLAVLIGGSDFRWYTVADQPELRARIVAIERDFWDRVESGNPPEADWSHPDTPELIARLHRPEPDQSIELGRAGATLAEEYDRIGQELARLELSRARVKGQLIQAMGHASQGILPDGRVVLRKVVQRKAYTVEATAFETLRIRGKR
jgi:putative phage-type endonuclease